MKRAASLGHRLALRAFWAAAAFAGATIAMPAQAQTSQVEVSGYVAPRCWVQPSAEGMLLPRAICNQSTPRLESRMRTLGDDGALTAMLIPAAYDPREGFAQQSARAAMEIVVSPQL
jgi:hypothetical protein